MKETTRLSAEIRPIEDSDSSKRWKVKNDVVNCHYDVSVGFLDLQIHFDWAILWFKRQPFWVLIVCTCKYDLVKPYCILFGIKVTITIIYVRIRFGFAPIISLPRYTKDTRDFTRIPEIPKNLVCFLTNV